MTLNKRDKVVDIVVRKAAHAERKFRARFAGTVAGAHYKGVVAKNRDAAERRFHAARKFHERTGQDLAEYEYRRRRFLDDMDD